MRRFARRLLLIIGIIFLIGVAEISLVEGVSAIDALFSAFTMFLTGEPGGLHFDEISTFTKGTAVLLILLGAVAMAAVFGLVADYLLSSRLEQLLGSAFGAMENHVILVGMSRVGYRILEELRWFGNDVCVIEAEDNEFTRKARDLDNVQVLIGDIHSPEILQQANVEKARSLIVVSDDDLVNVEVALNARELKPDLPIVLRMFDQRMARKLQSAFNIRCAFSTTALAAPAFAAAAQGDSLLNSFRLGGDTMLVTADIEIEQGGKLSKTPFEKIRREVDFTVLRHVPRGRPEKLHPQNIGSLAAGDRLTVVCSLEALKKLRELNSKVPAAL
ncbi:MAG: NAD-binding protein [Armatimonadetes bacterium]|nr:NAD-binding protein [Armatimonadota bacterium]